MRQIIGVLVMVAACNGGHGLDQIDPTIGATCASDRDCQDRCFLGPSFPGGFCSLTCASDRDCPTDTFCIDIQGGVCMYACPAFDCTRLGAGWGCHDENRVGGGKTSVCGG